MQRVASLLYSAISVDNRIVGAIWGRKKAATWGTGSKATSLYIVRQVLTCGLYNSAVRQKLLSFGCLHCPFNAVWRGAVTVLGGFFWATLHLQEGGAFHHPAPEEKMAGIVLFTYVVSHGEATGNSCWETTTRDVEKSKGHTVSKNSQKETKPLVFGFETPRRCKDGRHTKARGRIRHQFPGNRHANVPKNRTAGTAIQILSGVKEKALSTTRRSVKRK